MEIKRNHDDVAHSLSRVGFPVFIDFLSRLCGNRPCKVSPPTILVFGKRVRALCEGKGVSSCASAASVDSAGKASRDHVDRGSRFMKICLFALCSSTNGWKGLQLRQMPRRRQLADELQLDDAFLWQLTRELTLHPSDAEQDVFNHQKTVDSKTTEPMQSVEKSDLFRDAARYLFAAAVFNKKMENMAL